MLTRRTFLALSGTAAGAAILAPTAGLAATDVAILGGDAFGTYWRLSVPAGTGVETAPLAAIVAEVDRAFSPYRADSALSAFNRADTTDWLPAAPDVISVLAQGLAISVTSAGAFDPTVGPLVNRYGFGPIHAESWGGADRLEVDSDAIRKADSGLSLDLCGIAKGHALDRMATELTRQGVADFLLDLGGEVCARGRHPAGRDWRVAIERLTGDLPLAVSLDGRAIATSGIAAQSYGSGAGVVSHIIDPRRGTPVGSDTVTASVLADDATTADGWATALMAMPHEQALDVAEKAGIDALLFVHDGETLRPLTAGRFTDHLVG